MVQGGDPIAEAQVCPGIEGMPVRIMGGNPVQQGDCVMIPVGQDVVFSGFEFRIVIIPGPVPGLLLVLLTAEEGGEWIKAETEITEGILLLAAAVIVLAVAALGVAALGSSPGASEGIVIAG